MGNVEHHTQSLETGLAQQIGDVASQMRVIGQQVKAESLDVR